VVLDYGYLKNPTGMVLDLINNTAFVGDEAGNIWAVDMDYTTNENQNVSQVRVSCAHAHYWPRPPERVVIFAF